MELANIAANKNTVPGDKSALIPFGLRIGSPAMTTRGLVEKDFDKISEFIDRGVKLAIKINGQVKGTKLKDFKEHLGEGEGIDELSTLKKEVIDFSKQFPTIGFEEIDMKYK